MGAFDAQRLFSTLPFRQYADEAADWSHYAKTQQERQALEMLALTWSRAAILADRYDQPGVADSLPHTTLKAAA